jgi:membrane fusion protein, copper/silver efflux system
LFISENDSTNKTLLDAAKEKLRLLGLTNTQINALIQKKEVSGTIGIFSNSSGYVITGEGSSPSVSTNSPSQDSGGMSDGMSSASASTSSNLSPAQTNTSSLIREGIYVSTGQTLFNVVNTDALRIELDLPASQTSLIKPGDALTVDIGDGLVETKVDFVQPFYNEGQEFVKVRVNIKNSKALQIGQLVTARITTSGSESLWVPRESVLDLGSEKIVFVKDRKVLKPRAVNTGTSSEGWIEIKSGLASMDEIAANAQYLVDSESFIKTTN